MNFPFPIHSSHHFPSRSDDNVSDSLWSVRLFKYTQNIKWAPLFLRRSFLMKATTSWWEDDVMRMPHCLQICGHRFTYCCAISGIIHPHHDWSQATVRAIGSFIVQIICCGGKRRIGPETGLDWTARDGRTRHQLSLRADTRAITTLSAAKKTMPKISQHNRSMHKNQDGWHDNDGRWKRFTTLRAIFL